MKISKRLARRSSTHFKLLRHIGLVLGIAVLSACGGGQSEEALLADARARYAEGESRAAIIQLKNLLQQNPDNVEGRLLRAEIALKMRDGATAEKDLNRAQELGVAPGEIVVMLGKALMAQQAFDRVVTDIHTGAALDDQARIAILLLRGDAYLGLGKIDNAAKAFRDVSRLKPDSPDALAGQGRAAQANGDNDGALTFLARAISSDPDLPRLWRANGEVQLRAGQPTQAIESFMRALQLEPVVSLEDDNFFSLVGVYQAKLALNEMDDALDVAEQALALGRSHPVPNYLRGQHAMLTGDLDIAAEHLLKTLISSPFHVGALTLMGSLRLEQGNLAEAETYLRSALGRDSDDPRVRMQLAETMLQLNDGDSALQLLAPMLKETGDVAELLALAGRATAVSQDSADWLSYFQQAAAADPNNVRWQFELAQAYLAAGRPKQSVEVLQRIADSADTIDRRELMLVNAHRRAGDLDQALATADQLLARNPDDPATRILLGKLNQAAGDLEAARQYLDSVLQEDSANIPALLALGQVEVSSEAFDEADALYRRAFTIQPGNLNTVTRLVALAERRGDRTGAIEWLESGRLMNPEALMPRLGLVHLHLLQNDVGQAYENAQEAVALQPDNVKALIALGKTQMRREEYQAAIFSFEGAAVQAPRDGMVQYQLSRAHYNAGNMKSTQRALEKAVFLAPRHVQYSVALAEFELGKGKPVKAASIAETLTTNHPDHPAGYRLLGAAYDRQGRNAEAAQAYALAVEKGQNAELVIKQYGSLMRAGDREAHQVLADWLVDHPDQWRVRVQLAQTHQRHGRDSEAIEQYERVIENNPDNALALNNLAWLYDLRDDPRALELAERALALQPHVGTFSDTVGWMLVRRDQLERGTELIRKAALQSPSLGEIRYHLAAALVQSGEIDEARLLLTELIDSGEQFDSVVEARRLLEQL